MTKKVDRIGYCVDSDNENGTCTCQALCKNPPRIVIHGNNLKQLQDSYTRYLENFFRRELNLGSTPLEISYKEQSNPYKSKPNLLNERQKKKRKRMIKRRKK